MNKDEILAVKPKRKVLFTGDTIYRDGYLAGLEKAREITGEWNVSAMVRHYLRVEIDRVKNEGK